MFLVKTSQRKSVLKILLEGKKEELSKRMQGQGQRALTEGKRDVSLFLGIPPGAERNSYSANGEQLFKQRC